jgi:hypothetical protein
MVDGKSVKQVQRTKLLLSDFARRILTVKPNLLLGRTAGQNLHDIIEKRDFVKYFGLGFNFRPGCQVDCQSHIATILVCNYSVIVSPPTVEFFFREALLNFLLVYPASVNPEVTDGLAEGEPSFFHNEIYDVALGAAPPANKALLIGIDAKRGFLFLMKRAQAPKEVPSLVEPNPLVCQDLENIRLVLNFADLRQ